MRANETPINNPLKINMKSTYYDIITYSFILINIGVPYLMDIAGPMNGVWRILIGGMALKKAP